MNNQPTSIALVVGPDPAGHGGMSGVMRWFAGLPDGSVPGYRVEWVASHGGVTQRTVGSALTSLAATARVMRTIRRLRPAVVHVLVGSRGSLVRKALIARYAEAKGARVVVHIHSGAIERALMGEPNEDADDTRVKALLKHASVVATLWHGPRAGMRTHAPNALWEIVGNALPEREAGGPVMRDVDVVYAGRLAAEKGSDLLLEVLRLMSAAGMRIVVAGSPSDAEGERAFAELRSLSGVETPGWVEPGELNDLIGRSKVLLLPSKTEALPLSALEAMASGCAVVGSAVGGLVELLAEGRGVLMTDAAPAPVWAETVRDLAGDGAKREAMARRAAEWAAKRYSAEAVLGQVAHAYDQALSDTAPAPHVGTHRIDVLGAGVDDVGFDEAVEIAVRAASSGTGGRCVSRNASTSVAMDHAHALRVSFRSPLLALPDGSSIVWASRVLGRPLRERVTGIDFADALLARCAEEGVAVYLLGSTETVLDSVVERCARRHPDLRIAGRHDGYYRDPDEMARAVAESGAGVVLLGMTSPMADGFCVQYESVLAGRVLVVVGGTFDVWSGRLNRAPEAWQRAGMEWAYRLVQEPRRLLWRYASTNTVFVVRVFAQRLRELAAPARGDGR